VVTQDELTAALEPDEVDYDRIIRFIGRDAFPFLPALIDGDRPDIAAKATSLAGLLTGQERLPALERAAHSSHAVVRIAAAAAAQNISGPEAERLVPLLLDDAEPAVRKLAIQASELVPGVPQVQAALNRVAADDPVVELRDLAARLPRHE
jgi:HEAT repeat protein